jgi:hypothetical protein
MGDQVLVAPPGVHDQMYRGDGGPQRMPTPPRQANSLIVGGPAYFTPEGYQAPVQPQEAFMPTRREYDPIRDQFNRMYPTPPPPPPAPAPAPAPTPVYEPVVEPVARQTNARARTSSRTTSTRGISTLHSGCNTFSGNTRPR